MRLEKDFFNRNARQIARDLLGKVIIRRIGSKKLKARIVETEAYLDHKDPASRARQKGDLRTTMAMAPGTVLVYGVHHNWLINFVTAEEGKPEAVLLRALEPLNFEANCKGPGLLTRALKVNKDFHKKDICNNPEIWIEDDKNLHEIIESFRVGIKKDLPEKMRFYLKNSKHVSRK